jgi:hypothetical protein
MTGRACPAITTCTVARRHLSKNDQSDNNRMLHPTGDDLESKREQRADLFLKSAIKTAVLTKLQLLSAPTVQRI